MSQAVTKHFQYELDEANKDALLAVFAASTSVSHDEMKHYFGYYRGEMLSSAILRPPPIDSFPAAIELLELLKSRAREPRKDILSLGKRGPSLDVAVRAMLVTACMTPGTYTGDIFNPMWEKQESLVQFIDRVYPKYDPPDEDKSPVTTTKLAAHVAAGCHIEIEWTGHLTDHLELRVGPNWKRLFVFQFPSYLKMCLGTLKNQSAALDQDTATSLALGCLPPALLIETLRTYDILFPRADGASQEAMSDAIEHDAAFASPLSIYSPHQSHKTPRDARGPANVQDLYKRYPHWGERLHVLWREIENPTPMTGVEKWTEKRRGYFWTTWWGILGVTAAIVSLIITMGLGGVQVWIGYCAWMEDGSVMGCGAKNGHPPHDQTGPQARAVWS